MFNIGPYDRKTGKNFNKFQVGEWFFWVAIIYTPDVMIIRKLYLSVLPLFGWQAQLPLHSSTGRSTLAALRPTSNPQL